MENGNSQTASCWSVYIGFRLNWNHGRLSPLSKTGQRRRPRPARTSSRFVHRITDKLSSRPSGGPIASTAASPQRPGHPCSPFLTGRMFVRRTYFGQLSYDSFLNWTFSSPNMVRTVRRTLLRSQVTCNEMQASARTCGRRAADSMIENVG